MKFIQSITLLNTILLLSACSGGGDDSTTINDPVQPKFEATSLELYVNSELMIADGNSTLRFYTKAFDADGNSKDNLTGVKFFINGNEHSKTEFTTSDVGEYNVYATYGEVETTSLSFSALKPKEYPIVEIPVIFHVGEYEGQDYSHINEEYVQELINLLNKGFSGGYETKNLNAVDTGIRFRLATVDPDGNALSEKGLTRFDAKQYDDGGAHYTPFGELYNTPNNIEFGTFEVYRMASEQHWPQHLYKNVYIAPYEDANWAVFYQLNDNSTISIPGVEKGIEYFEDGSLYTDILLLAPYDHPGGVFIHEMGHSLGLWHPESYDGCVTADYVSDTMSIDFMDHEHICEIESLGQRFIDNPNTIHLDNFMHGANRWEVTGFYSEYNNFTYGQRERMRSLISEGKYISELINSNR